MHRLLPEEVAEFIKQTVEGLGSTKDDVLATLRSERVVGHRASPHDGPVANYINRKLDEAGHPWKVLVTSIEIEVDRGLGFKLYTPDPVRQAIQSITRYEHLDLLHPYYHKFAPKEAAKA